jgi:hypothetical protein
MLSIFAAADGAFNSTPITSTASDRSLRHKGFFRFVSGVLAERLAASHGLSPGRYLSAPDWSALVMRVRLAAKAELSSRGF